MKYRKQIIAAVIAAVLTATALPFAFPAKAATNGVQKKLDELKAVYDTGTYFTADGNICYSNQCDNCSLSRIPSRGGLPSGAEVYAQLKNESWSCRSFADYVFYYIFGEAYWDLKKTECASLGDFIKFNGGAHSAIYLWEDADNYYVYDSNGDSTNMVCYNKAYSKDYWRLSGIYHANSYKKIMNGGSSAVFKELTEGSYFIANAQNGRYIARTVPAASGALFTLTASHSTTLTAEVKKTDGVASLRIPVGTAENAEWLFEVVAGGYVIRSASQPSKALTANADNTVSLAEYAGTAAQIWKIETAYHKLAVQSFKTATCAARGETVYACADCDYTYTEYQEQKPHIYTVETIEPTDNSYGFTKYKCVHCGEVLRKDVKDKLDEMALVDTGSVIQLANSYVYVSTEATEEELLDAFPGYDAAESPACATGATLIPRGVESVPEKDILTVILPGDIDGDGHVTAGDARAVLRVCVHMDQLTEVNEERAADIDFDGKVATEDARWILRTAVGYETGATTLAGIAIE